MSTQNNDGNTINTAGEATRLDGASRDKILKAINKVPPGLLKMIMADGNVSPAELKSALAQAGLSTEEIEGICTVSASKLLHAHGEQSITPEEQEKMTAIAHIIEGSINTMKGLLDTGNIAPEMKPADKNLAHRTSEVEGTATQGMGVVAPGVDGPKLA
jgi:hypothetical protein